MCWAIVTRNNLFGREQSASIQGTYGLLEQNINLLYQSPHFFGNRDIGFTFSGGYASSQNVTTYVSSKLETGVRWNQHFSQPGSLFSKANTFVYEFDFRRVKVAAETLQVGPSEIEALSTAVRVAGPSITWIRDTRDSPLDSRRGTYTSFQNFLSDSILWRPGRVQPARSIEFKLLRIRQEPVCSGAQHEVRSGTGVWTPICQAASIAGAPVCRRAHFASRFREQCSRPTRP